MKTQEYRSKTPEELQAELNAVLKARFNLKMQLATQQTKNTSELGRLRKSVARIKTILCEKANKV
jgi:large subunit ribosomal protein L29